MVDTQKLRVSGKERKGLSVRAGLTTRRPKKRGSEIGIGVGRMKPKGDQMLKKFRESPVEHCGLITSDQVEKMRQESFRKGYRDGVTDEAALGIHVAKYFKWNGYAIIRTLHAALEDANFHTENGNLMDTFPEAFQGE